MSHADNVTDFMSDRRRETEHCRRRPAALSGEEDGVIRYGAGRGWVSKAKDAGKA